MIKKILVFIFGLLLSFKYFPLRFIELFGQLFPENSYGCMIRGFLYRPFLKQCGSNFQVGLQVKLEHLNNINIGNDVYIGHGSWISGLRGGVTLEDQVLIGPYVRIISSNHTFKDGSARFAPGVGEAIIVGFGSWIASGVTITSGVKIGKSCLLAASSVITKNIEEDSIVVGIPGRIIGKVSEKYCK
ncbi:hypothetical protein CPT03_16585 [Pedobacter ginsengisoli]|uniref:Transferase n=1 Tax=Pedobacter ginsengisoli TaxID=363852 RepID=A0A2D1U8M4_9SPHI|nr:acyltransferase [Pedobacter ginsengisoli]ATP57963.1 hypothetical protein CPT03_16585 [Pedobacter ginsengisoli]